jgi:flagellar motility protein MotE (MotC chaperone)
MSVKLTPLTALAVALGALGLAQAGRLAFDATNAFAAGDAPAPAPAPAAKAAAPAAAAPAEGPPMCLPVDLAKEAGISAAEFRLLQSLQERRQTLDARERDIVTRENVIKAADMRVQERMASLKQVEAGIQRLLGQLDEAESQRIASLVKVYEKMKPKDAAEVFEGLDDDVLLKIASRMKEQPLSLILAKVEPTRARRITAMLAAMDAPPAPAARPPVAAPPPARPPAKGETKAAAATPPAPGARPGAAPPAANPAPPGAGPAAPKAPEAKGPTPPAAPKSAARPASGQAPADPPASQPKAG